MPLATNQAQPALDFIPPNYSATLRRVMWPLMPAWTAWKTDLAEIETHNVQTLAQLYQEFNQGKSRLMLAFRHPSPVDPFVLSHLIWRSLPQVSREQGTPLRHTHAHFIYDRGIPLWAGRYLGWVFSKLGGVPIQRGKLDLLALKTARALLLDGQFPLAAAPEGGNNGHNEIVSPLEPGIAQLAFWCVEDLRKADRQESVVVLPIGIQYRYIEEPWQPLNILISEMERDSGLAADDRLDLYERLYRLATHLLTLMEGYYREFYGVEFEVVETPLRTSLSSNQLLSTRLNTLMDEALKVAENYFNVRPKGSFIDRCRKLEQAGWDRIFREDTEHLSPVDLGLANRVAEESNLRMWHMRLVESFVAVTGHYVKENPSADRFAETALLLKDMIEKITGRPMSRRTQLGAQRAIATVGKPIVVSERFADYQSKRRRAVSALTADLQSALELLIVTA